MARDRTRMHPARWPADRVRGGARGARGLRAGNTRARTEVPAHARNPDPDPGGVRLRPAGRGTHVARAARSRGGPDRHSRVVVAVRRRRTAGHGRSGRALSAGRGGARLPGGGAPTGWTCTATWSATFVVDGLGPFAVREPVTQTQVRRIRWGRGGPCSAVTRDDRRRRGDPGRPRTEHGTMNQISARFQAQWLDTGPCRGSTRGRHSHLDGNAARKEVRDQGQPPRRRPRRPRPPPRRRLPAKTAAQPLRRRRPAAKPRHEGSPGEEGAPPRRRRLPRRRLRRRRRRSREEGSGDEGCRREEGAGHQEGGSGEEGGRQEGPCRKGPPKKATGQDVHRRGGRDRGRLWSWSRPRRGRRRRRGRPRRGRPSLEKDLKADLKRSVGHRTGGAAAAVEAEGARASSSRTSMNDEPVSRP